MYRNTTPAIPAQNMACGPAGVAAGPHAIFCAGVAGVVFLYTGPVHL